MTLSICQFSPAVCGYPAAMQCIVCGKHLCTQRHMGDQLDEGPHSHEGLQRWWEDFGRNFSGYSDEVRSWIIQRLFRFTRPTCGACRVKQIQRELPNVMQQIAEARQQAGEEARRKLNYARSNWHPILEHFFAHTPATSVPIRFFRRIRGYKIGHETRPTTFYGAQDTQVYLVRYVTRDRKLFSHELAKPNAVEYGKFTPDQISGGHWLYQYAERHGLIRV